MPDLKKQVDSQVDTPRNRDVSVIKIDAGVSIWRT